VVVVLLLPVVIVLLGAAIFSLAEDAAGAAPSTDAPGTMLQCTSGTLLFVTAGPRTVTIDGLVAPVGTPERPRLPAAFEVERPRDSALDTLVLATLQAWADDAEQIALTYAPHLARMVLSGRTATMTFNLERVVGLSPVEPSTGNGY
jgi:hypothetical protein